MFLTRTAVTRAKTLSIFAMVAHACAIRRDAGNTLLEDLRFKETRKRED